MQWDARAKTIESTEINGFVLSPIKMFVVQMDTIIFLGITDA